MRAPLLIGTAMTALFLTGMSGNARAQNFCVPEGTAYYSFEQSFLDRGALNDSYNGNEQQRNGADLPTFSTLHKHGNYAASFNGSSQFVQYSGTTLPGQQFLRKASSSFSIMFWFRTGTVTGTQTLFEWGGQSSGVCIRLEGNQLKAQAKNSTSTAALTMPSTLTAGTWYHVALTHEAGQNMILYINGTAVATGAAISGIDAVSGRGGIGATLGDNVFGTDFGSGEGDFFNGQMDEFWFGDSDDVPVLTATQVNDYLNCVENFAGSKWSCDSRAIIVDTSASELRYYSSRTNSFTNIKVDYTLTFNGIGYNVKDSFVYGTRVAGNNAEENVANKAGDLLRINHDGTLEDLGPIAGVANNDYPAGCFDTSGNYYFATHNNIYKLQPTALPLTATLVGAYPANAMVSDFAYTLDGHKLMGVNHDNGRIMEIGLAPFSITQTVPDNSDGNAALFSTTRSYGGVWADFNDNLYIVSNNGFIYNYNRSSNQRSLIRETRDVQNSDACNCPIAGVDPKVQISFQQFQTTPTDTFAVYDIKVSSSSEVPVSNMRILHYLEAGSTLNAAGTYTQLYDYDSTSLLTQGAYNPRTDQKNPSIVAETVSGANELAPYYVGSTHPERIALTTGTMIPGDTGTFHIRMKVKVSNVRVTTYRPAAIIESIFGKTVSNGSPATTADNSSTVYGDVAANNESVTSFIYAAPLPVTLLDFSLQPVEGKVYLSWMASREQDIVSYEVQRSVDGREWKAIGSVKATNTALTHAYRYCDEEPVQGAACYRLKILGRDGSAGYSAVLRLSIQGKDTRLLVYPNPAADRVSIALSASGEAVFSLSDGSGRVVKSGILEGMDTHTVELRSLPAGMYLLQVRQGERSWYEKVQVQP